MALSYKAMMLDAMRLEGWTHDIARNGWTNGSQFISEWQLDEEERKIAYPAQRVVDMNRLANQISGRSQPKISPPFYWPDETKLKCRLNMRPTDDFPWPHFAIYRGTDVVSLIIGQKNGNVTVLNDDPVTFPSDGLLAKIHLILP